MLTRTINKGVALMSHFLRPVVGLWAAVMLVLAGVGLDPSPAHAAEIHHSAVFPAGWPAAAAPGQKINYSARFVNTRRIPDVLKFRASVWCWDKAGVRVEFAAKWKNVTVPGANPNGGGGAISSSASATVPKTCRFDKVLYDIGGYTAATLIEVAPRSASAATGAFPINWNIYQVPFSKSNYVFNLTLGTPKPSYPVQAHHTLPQTFGPQWAKVGLNNHDPKYLRWWCSKAGVATNHQSKAAVYNKLWRDYFIKHSNPTKAEILAYRNAIQGQFKYTC
jgi:hypothetical protein